MKLGAEKNKVILLGVLLTIACATVYTQFFSGPKLGPAARRPATSRASATPQRKTTRRQRPASRPARGQTFRPSFGSGDDSGEPLDAMTVDPTLRTDLLAKVRGVEFSGVERNIFRFGQRKPKVPVGPTPEELAEAARRTKEAASNSAPGAAKIKATSEGTPSSPDQMEVLRLCQLLQRRPKTSLFVGGGRGNFHRHGRRHFQEAIPHRAHRSQLDRHRGYAVQGRANAALAGKLKLAGRTGGPK